MEDHGERGPRQQRSSGAQGGRGSESSTPSTSNNSVSTSSPTDLDNDSVNLVDEQLLDQFDNNLAEMFYSFEEPRRSWERFLEMVGGLEHAAFPSTDRAVVQQPHNITISEEHVNNNLTCSICFDDFELGAEASKPNCGHIYHSTCLSKWRAFGDTCPLCRSRMSK